MISFKSFIMLNEGFKEAKQKWMEEGYSSDYIDDVLSRFKEMVKKNQITGDQKDIGYWQNRTVMELNEYVDGVMDKYHSSRPLKKLAKMEDAPVLFESPNIIIYQILSKAAACKLASNMPWCLAKQNQDYYEWHKDHGYDITFILDKNDVSKKLCYIQNEHKFSIWDWDNQTISEDMMWSWLEARGVYEEDMDEVEDIFPMDTAYSAPNYNNEDDTDDEEGGMEEHLFQFGTYEFDGHYFYQSDDYATTVWGQYLGFNNRVENCITDILKHVVTLRKDEFIETLGLPKELGEPEILNKIWNNSYIQEFRGEADGLLWQAARDAVEQIVSDEEFGLYDFDDVMENTIDMSLEVDILGLFDYRRFEDSL
jgi:hypothetical protein